MTHLADSEATTSELVNQAMGIAQRDSNPERDPLLLLGAGALVLWVFRVDIDLTHEAGNGGKFHFRTTCLSDSTIAKLLGQLVGAYRKP